MDRILRLQIINSKEMQNKVWHYHLEIATTRRNGFDMTGPKWQGKPRKNMRKPRDPLYGAAKAVKTPLKGFHKIPMEPRLIIHLIAA